MNQKPSNIPEQEKSLDQIYTVPNAITFVRLMLIPFAFSLLVQGSNDILAFILFVVAAGSDFVDGQIARRTNQVSELGKVIDPLVDRFLIAAGLTGLYVVGRIPLWILCALIARDFYLFIGLTRLKAQNASRLKVVFLGKLTTATLLIGFSGLIANFPVMKGLSLTRAPWLPGFNGSTVPVWIYFVYLGMIFSFAAAALYTKMGRKALKETRQK